MSSMKIERKVNSTLLKVLCLGHISVKLLQQRRIYIYIYIYIYICPNTLRAPPPRQMSIKATRLIDESGAKEQPVPFVE